MCKGDATSTGPLTVYGLCTAAGSPDGNSQYMESRPLAGAFTAGALSPRERASPARLQAMADIAGRKLQCAAAQKRLHMVPGEHHPSSPD